MTTFETTSDPLHGTILLLFFVFSRFLPPWPKNAPKLMEKAKKQKTKKCFTPCRLSSFSSDPLHGWKLFFLVSRGFCHCVSPTISVAHFFVFFVFLFLGLLGELFALTNIHWHSFHPSTCYIDVLIELLILAIEPSENIYRKNSSITHLFRHSIGLMFYWYAEVWFLIFKDLARVLQTWNHKTYIFKNGLFKQHFVVQKNVSQSVCSFKNAILYPSRQDSSKEECCFPSEETDAIL